MRNRKKKGQASVEFLVYASFFMVLFVVATAHFIDQYQQDVVKREGELAKEFGAGFADEINMMVAVGDSFEANFTFEKNLLGSPYDVTFSDDGFVIVNWSRGALESTYAYPLSTQNITAGNGVDEIEVEGVNYIQLDESKGKYMLVNEGGGITISQEQ